METSEKITPSLRKKSRKRKFSEEQIRSLEFLFQSEARPEAQIKQKVATDLGLHPRQVAIWFQNKRARSKSKQIEQDYAVLKSSYDHLALQFESLERENHNLAIQVNAPSSLYIYICLRHLISRGLRMFHGFSYPVAATERWAEQTSWEWEGRRGIRDQAH